MVILCVILFVPISVVALAALIFGFAYKVDAGLYDQEEYRERES
jgi:nitrogen fixation-related uncharacterized protein